MDAQVRDLLGRLDFYIKKLSGPGWLMPITVNLLRDAKTAIQQLSGDLEVTRLQRDAKRWTEVPIDVTIMRDALRGIRNAAVATDPDALTYREIARIADAALKGERYDPLRCHGEPGVDCPAHPMTEENQVPCEFDEKAKTAPEPHGLDGIQCLGCGAVFPEPHREECER